MILTEGQNKALKQLYDWSSRVGDNSLFYTLAGSAGTGKTTIASYFIEDIRKSRNVCVTAPTHKACRVISNVTGIKAKTIHQMLGFRPSVNIETFDVKNLKFESLGTKHISAHDMFIIDESSMLNESIVNLIVTEAKLYNTKILFVGDELQLPPIGESLSTVFTRFTENMFTLTEIVRQENENPVSKLLDLARTDVRYNTSNTLQYLYTYPCEYNEYGGFVVTTGNSFTEYVTNAFKDSKIFENTSWCKFGAYTNDNIKVWNSYIRKIVLPESDTLVIKDDLLIGYTTLVDEFLSPIIINSDEYIVKDVLKYSNNEGISGYATKLINALTNEETKYLFIVDTFDAQNVMRFSELLNSRIARAYKDKMWKLFFDWRNTYQLLTDIYSNTNKLLASKDLDYAYAITVHKLQGSTVTNMFTNVNDIVFNKSGFMHSDINLRNRLLYVALSRAKEKEIINL